MYISVMLEGLKKAQPHLCTLAITRRVVGVLVSLHPADRSSGTRAELKCCGSEDFYMAS